jgi:hypothetical protein
VTQTAWLILALKVALISGFVSLIGWIALYSVLASWIRNPIGRTLVAKTTLIACLFVPSILSLFFHLSARDSYTVGWVDTALIGLVSPVMWWRCLVWWRLHKAGRLPGNSASSDEKEDVT